MGDLLGHLRPEAAKQLGLPAGLPVAEGGADAFVGMVGLNVVAPGKVALITGSSNLYLAQTGTPSYSAGLFGAYTDAVMPGQYTLEGGQVSTGSVVRWFSELASGTHFGNAVPKEQVFRALRDEAERIPPGSDGVMVLDFWQGNRTPYVDAKARGMIWGLSLAHTPAHIYRALLEAICYGAENIFRNFTAAGHPVKDVVACGGALNSDLWMQIHADVSNLPIAIPRVGEAVTLGAAMLASVVGGVHPDVAAAAREMVSIERYVEPRPGMNEAYQFFFDKYIASYEAMRPLMHEVVIHVSK
jgi:ribulose kinase